MADFVFFIVFFLIYFHINLAMSEAFKMLGVEIDETKARLWFFSINAGCILVFVAWFLLFFIA